MKFLSVVGERIGNANKAALVVILIVAVMAVGLRWMIKNANRTALIASAVARDPDIEEFWGLFANLHLMQTVALGTAFIGGTLMVLIALTGWLARRRRILPFLSFAPLLHLTMLTLSLLMIRHAGLGLATLYYGESVFIGGVHLGIMLALGIGAWLGVSA